MEAFVAIKYQQLRDFSEKINTTFYFIRQNFKSLGKALIFIAGPPALLVSLVFGNLFSDLFSQIAASKADPQATLSFFTSVSFWLQMTFISATGIVAYVLTLATVNSYLKLYERAQTNKIDLTRIWEEVRSIFLKYLGAVILYVVLFVVVLLIGMIPVVILSTVSPVLVFFGFSAFFVGSMYIWIATQPIFVIQVFENRGFFEALTRSFFLVKGKWWSTFGLVFILSLIGGVLSYVIVLPFSIVANATLMHDITEQSQLNFDGPMATVFQAMFALYYVTQILFSSLTHLGIAFQYFNLVEIKEARGLMSDIEKFGQAPDTATNQREEQY
ncbi:MAG: hypothetical protein ACKOE6_05690 [Flammeovirgaceae bacterium]